MRSHLVPFLLALAASPLSSQSKDHPLLVTDALPQIYSLRTDQDIYIRSAFGLYEIKSTGDALVLSHNDRVMTVLPEWSADSISPPPPIPNWVPIWQGYGIEVLGLLRQRMSDHENRFWIVLFFEPLQAQPGPARTES